MVSTRRSARLEEKEAAQTEAAAAPSSPIEEQKKTPRKTPRKTPSKSTPTSAKSASKKTPKSAKGRGKATKCTAPRSRRRIKVSDAQSGEENATDDPAQEQEDTPDHSAEEEPQEIEVVSTPIKPLSKKRGSSPAAATTDSDAERLTDQETSSAVASDEQDQAEQHGAQADEETDGADTKAKENKEQKAIDSSSVGVVPEAQAEEEEEFVMMNEEGDHESEVHEQPSRPVVTEEEDPVEVEECADDDIEKLAMVAASGFDFGSKSSSSSSKLQVASRKKNLATHLVPDTLDSGVNPKQLYFDFRKQRKASGVAQMDKQKTDEAQRKAIRFQEHVAAQSRQQRETSNREMNKTAGKKWFDMQSHELTSDVRKDFALLRMRNYLDPKKFYKTTDYKKQLPKHFQLGTVVEGAHEFKSSRLTKKERQQTLTEEVMADYSIRAYTKRVFGQVQAAKSGEGRKKKRRQGK